MTQLFVRFYVSVLIVLFLAWYIHGKVLAQRTDAEWARIVEEAHGGGARLVASEIDAAAPQQRDKLLHHLRERFDYPVEIVPLAELPDSTRQQILGGSEVANSMSGEGRRLIVAKLAGDSEVVRLGPFPQYRLAEIEDSIAGWMRLAAEEIDAAPTKKNLNAVLKRLQKQFDIAVEITNRDDLPNSPRSRIAGGDDVVFFSQESGDSGQSYAVTPLSNGKQVVRFGPFPSFEDIEQKAATTTLALVLFPAAVAIALLLRPVARQLRHVEGAAKSIAAGDLSARVDERRVRSVRPLAQSFNHMADRTETLVRTQRELLQAVSHELRTPLARMRFAIELIESAKSDDQRRARLDSLEAATEELDELVGELLGYVRLETADAPPLELQPVPLAEAIDTLIENRATLYPAIGFDTDAVKQGPQVVCADERGFHRAVGNLIGNACRFAEGRLRVCTADLGDCVAVDVEDDGVGIPEKDWQRVLQPFVRLENGEGQGSRGMGLGLALVKRIVTSHGGRVEVSDSSLGGCRVRTTWPKQCET